MDPNAALERIRKLCEALNANRDGTERLDSSDLEDAANELVEYVGALDEWLSKGGFLPQPWLYATHRH